MSGYTVESPNKVHFGNRPVVLGSRKIIVNISIVILVPPLLSTYTLCYTVFFMNFPLILSALPVIHAANYILS